MNAPDRGARWARARNVLAVRLDGMGDLLMTEPALRALRGGAPDRRLTLLTSAAGAAVAALMPEIHEVIVYDAPWMKSSRTRLEAAGDRRMIEALRARHFDAAVVFTVYSQNPLPAAMLCLLADIPLRLAHCRENPYQLLTDWIHEREPEQLVRHEVRRQLDLVGALGLAVEDERISINVPPEAYARPRRLLSAAAIDLEGRWAVVHPGASAPSRRYRPDGYASVVRGLQASGQRVVLTGDASEVGLVEEVRAGAGAEAVSLAGALEVAELAALLAMAPVLVANNSGPVHLAAAVGTPVVDLYALTNPQHTPWGVESRVLFKDVPCRSCYKSVCLRADHACLDLIEPSEVIEAALAIEGHRSRR